jgi:Arc/MetJ-type ribon-helix-helix transcriptional regulator
MEVHLTDDQKAFVRQGIESGRYSRKDALADALPLWKSRERARARILAAVDAAEASLLRDGGKSLRRIPCTA